MGCRPVAVVIMHVHKYEIRILVGPSPTRALVKRTALQLLAPSIYFFLIYSHLSAIRHKKSATTSEFCNLRFKTHQNSGDSGNVSMKLVTVNKRNSEPDSPGISDIIPLSPHHGRQPLQVPLVQCCCTIHTTRTQPPNVRPSAQTHSQPKLCSHYIFHSSPFTSNTCLGFQFSVISHGVAR